MAGVSIDSRKVVFCARRRILKVAHSSEAFSRLTEVELSLLLDIKNARYLVWHFYDDSIFIEDASVTSTYSVVNGFEVVLPEIFSQNGIVDLTCEQHNEYRWLSEEEFKTSDEVHVHSRWYVDPEMGFLL